jgi:riboflavin synthase
MFTGIVQKTATIRSATMREKNRVISVEKPAGWKLSKGQSVAVDGICLTVIGTTSKTFEAELMPETLKKTTGGSFAQGKLVNLERALKLSDLLDGHLIQGHVDSRAKVTAIRAQGASTLITISIPKALRKQVALHGSVAVNGASLTIAKQNTDTLTVALIPYTLAHTNLGLLKKGDEVNLETDFWARHHEVKNYATVSPNAARRISKGTGGKRRLKA